MDPMLSNLIKNEGDNCDSVESDSEFIACPDNYDTRMIFSEGGLYKSDPSLLIADNPDFKKMRKLTLED